MNRKRLISSVLTLAILSLVFMTAAAEKFSIRGGITFGMTREQIRAFEEQQHQPQYIDEQDDYIRYDGFEDIIPNGYVSVYYGFANDKLCRYSMWEQYGKTDANIIALQTALKTKYGAPMFDDSQKELSLYTRDSFVELIKTYSVSDRPYEKKEGHYDQWVVPFDEGMVCIGFVYGTVTNTALDSPVIRYRYDLSYELISEEQIEEMMREKDEYETSILNAI